MSDGGQGLRSTAMKMTARLILDLLYARDDGRVNATELWIKCGGGQTQLKPHEYLRREATKRFIQETYGYSPEDPAVISKTGVGGGTFMKPEIFLDYAMWAFYDARRILALEFIHCRKSKRRARARRASNKN